MSQTVLITGCAGFIGSHLCEQLLRKGFQVIGIDNFDPFYDRQIKEQNIAGCIENINFRFYESDITDPNFYLPFKKKKIHTVIHLAAMAGVRPSISDPQAYVQNNIMGTLNVLNFMNNNHITRMIFSSSSSVYGNNSTPPFKESDLVDSPISPYAFTKSSCELLNHTYHHLYDLSIINLRFFTVYGPRQRPDLAINKFVRLMLQDAPIPVFGDGNTLRDYTYIDDIIHGIEKSIEYLNQRDKVFEIINLGNSKPVVLIDLIKTIGETLNITPKIGYLPKQPGDVDITCASISKAEQLLGYSPKVELKDGLIAFYDWYLSINTAKTYA
jgi:UDP-glucuronate 4-epimerase